MKSIAYFTPGSPEVLQLHDLPAPTIQKETEVLVKLQAAGINPIDTKLRSRGAFYPDRSPHVLGCDGAGVVEAVGAAVQGFQVGDEVFFCNGGLGGSIGTYAELAVVDERFLESQILNTNRACTIELPARTKFLQPAQAGFICVPVKLRGF